MKLILLSGGSGKRLWPLSNNQRSKQFIKLLNSNDGNLESMVQRVWGQLKKVGLSESTYIATSENQRSILKLQLGIDDNRIITEPSRRDTFSAICLAASYLYSELEVNLNETIVILPVDPYVEIGFFEKIKELDRLLNTTKSTLSLVGITPTYPSSKYGYILPKNDVMVESFKEKPSENIAERLINQGAIWNAGVFGFKLNTIIDLVNNKKLPTKFQDVYSNYSDFPEISFDYEFVEKQKNISYTIYNGYWKDLGTWNTLTEEMGTKYIGNTEMIDSKDTHIINELKLPIATIGVDNLIVAAGPEGILISTKKDSPRVKEINNKFFSTINYVEEDWGTSQVILESEEIVVVLYKLIREKEINIKLSENQKITKISGNANIIYKENRCLIKAEYNNFSFLLSMSKDRI